MRPRKRQTHPKKRRANFADTALCNVLQKTYFMVGITNSEPILFEAAGQREVVVFRRV